jgi:protein TonB
MTVQPKILNRDDVEKAVSRNYPPLLRDAGISGTTIVWFYIDENGRSIKQKVNKTSGYDALDNAALKVAEIIRFTPAENMGKKIPVWVQIPIQFQVK